MSLSPQKNTEIIAYEAFLRRAAELDLPFMLKGSYVTRQYFANPDDRIPNDQDWVYLEHLEYKSNASDVFDAWIIQVSEQKNFDGVQFRSFRENAFWRMIDYAMDDDFPTVNTDLDCWVDGESIDPLRVDISFNLPVELPPVPLVYQPVRGNGFTIPYTVPLALQVSWKLHQTLVRLRFKDLFDLMHLVVHPHFTAEVLHDSMIAMEKECSVDGTDPAKLRYLLNGDWDKIAFAKPLEKEWNSWRFTKWEGGVDDGSFYWTERAEKITDPDKLPATLNEFKDAVLNSFRVAGFYDLYLMTQPVFTTGVTIPDNEAVTPLEMKDEGGPSTQQGKAQSKWGFLRRLFGK